VISPLLANIYLHYVLDEWFEREVKPRLRGRAFLILLFDLTPTALWPAAAARAAAGAAGTPPSPCASGRCVLPRYAAAHD
jgi:hypothetical protein